MAYSWEAKDDLIALLLLKTGASEDILKKASIEIGCPVDSLKMRIKNFEFLKNGSGGMDHAAAQTKNIFNKFQALL